MSSTIPWSSGAGRDSPADRRAGGDRIHADRGNGAERGEGDVGHGRSGRGWTPAADVEVMTVESRRAYQSPGTARRLLHRPCVHLLDDAALLRDGQIRFERHVEPVATMSSSKMAARTTNGVVSARRAGHQAAGAYCMPNLQRRSRLKRCLLVHRARRARRPCRAGASAPGFHTALRVASGAFRLSRRRRVPRRSVRRGRRPRHENPGMQPGAGDGIQRHCCRPPRARRPRADRGAA